MQLTRLRSGQEIQKQVLRLTTPTLHPKEQRPLFGDPGTEKRLGPHSHPSDEDLSPGTPGSLRMTDIFKEP